MDFHTNIALVLACPGVFAYDVSLTEIFHHEGSRRFFWKIGRVGCIHPASWCYRGISSGHAATGLANKGLAHGDSVRIQVDQRRSACPSRLRRYLNG
ncbi:hypothetical protein K456DRAFT_1352624 [Colletotrichum gloeosporioides 23]|nr:hypothetical protein K456DRAFT_1352624 [Colletotrichum gloeosporioides 23]